MTDEQMDKIIKARDAGTLKIRVGNLGGNEDTRKD